MGKPASMLVIITEKVLLKKKSSKSLMKPVQPVTR